MKHIYKDTIPIKNRRSIAIKVLFVLLLWLIFVVIVISIVGLNEANNDRRRDIIDHAEQEVTLSAVKIESHVGRVQQILRKSAVAVGGGLVDLKCEDQELEIPLLFASQEGVVEGCTSSDVEGYLHLNIAEKKYFTFMDIEGIPMDNNQAERRLRHVVLKRKICLGSKTDKGAKMLEKLYSVVLTWWWKDPVNFISNYRHLLA